MVQVSDTGRLLSSTRAIQSVAVAVSQRGVHGMVLSVGMVFAIVVGGYALALRAGNAVPGGQRLAERNRLLTAFCLQSTTFGLPSADGSVCCTASCGVCGGHGCAHRPGGAKNCCGTHISKDSHRSCAKGGIPCTVDRTTIDELKPESNKWAIGLSGVRVYVLYTPQRLAFAKKSMRTFGLSQATTFVRGVEKDKVTLKGMIVTGAVTNYSGRTFGCTHCAVNEGRVACHLGHLHMFSKFLMSNSSIGLFFEDDAVLNPEVKGQLATADDIITEIRTRFEELHSHDPEWDILFFGRCFDDCRHQQRIATFIVKPVKPKCLHAYALSRQGAQMLMKSLVPMNDNTDSMVSTMITRGKLRAYARSPRLFSQARSRFKTGLGSHGRDRECRVS